MLLPEAFTVASISGLWRPRHWLSSRLRALYRAHNYVTMTVMLLIIVSQLMGLIILAENFDDLAEMSFLFIAVIDCSVKGLNMMIRRQRIVDLEDLFADEMCIPRNDEELQVCAYFDNLARFISLSCLLFCGLSAGCMAAWPLFFRGDNYYLSIRAWQPYEITNELRYYVTQIHQMVALMTLLFWNLSTDFVCPGFTIQICSQLQLMYHRLKCLPDDVPRQRQLLKQCVQHHLHIFEMTERLKTAFTPAILAQYLLSSVVLCISIYQLTANPSDFIQLLVLICFVSSMALELLLFCWFGNESLQLSEIMCEVDWTKLDTSNRRSLIIMMLRSSLPIRITCGPLITLSNDSYTGILKLSYSVFNVLQQTQK